MLRIGMMEQTDNGGSTILSGTKNTANDNELVAAPGAGKYIVVDWFIIQNESAVATTMQLRSGTDGLVRYLAQYQGDGLAMGYPIKLGANKALNFHLSGANQCGYTVAYHIE